MKRYFHVTIISFLSFLTFSFAQSCTVCGGTLFSKGFQDNQQVYECISGHINYRSSGNAGAIFSPFTKILKDRQAEADKDAALINDLLRKRDMDRRYAKERDIQRQLQTDQLNYIEPMIDPKKQFQFDNNRFYLKLERKNQYGNFLQ